MEQRTRLARLVHKGSRALNTNYMAPKGFKNSIWSFFSALKNHPPEAEQKNIPTLLQPVPPPRVYDRTRALEYLRDESVISYTITSRVLTELKLRSMSPKLILTQHDDIGDFSEFDDQLKAEASKLRVLDFGSGVGSGVWAATEVFNLHGIEDSIVAVEPVQLMNMLGKTMTHTLGETVSWRQYLDDSVKGKFDIVLFSFVSGEMNAKNVRDVILRLWRLVNRHGYLVVIEPGDKEGFQRVLQVRNLILGEFPPSNSSQEASYVVAPCPHNGNCPLQELPTSGTFKKMICNFPQRVLLAELPAGSMLKKRDFNARQRFANQYAYNYSYVVLGKGPDPRTKAAGLTAEVVLDDKEEKFASLVKETLEKQEKLVRRILEKAARARSVNPKAKQVEFQLPPVQIAAAAADEESTGTSQSDENHDAPQIDLDEVAEDVDFEMESSFEDMEEGEEDGVNSHEIRLSEAVVADEDFTRTVFTSHTACDRVIRSPLKKGGHVILDSCSRRGQLERRIVTKSQGRDRYSAARKAQWGDMWTWK